MEKYRNSKPPTVSEKTTGVDAVGGSSCSVNNKEGLVVADTISRSSSERTVMSSKSVASPSSDRSLEKNQNGSMSMWLEFDTWLDAQKKAPTDEEREEEEDTSIVRIETNILQNNAPEKKTKVAVAPERLQDGVRPGGWWAWWIWKGYPGNVGDARSAWNSYGKLSCYSIKGDEEYYDGAI